MPKSQRFLKLLLLALTPIMTLGAAGALAGSMWYSYSQSKYLAGVNAPSHDYRALVIREFDNQGCGSEESTFVQIERR